MNTTLEKKPNCEAELHVEVPAAEVRAKRQAILVRYRQLARVPGFRPGKTPIQVVEKRFARELEGELREGLVSAGCQAAAAEHKINILDVRALKDDTFQPDGNFTFTAVVTLEPEIELPEYKGIPVEAPAATVTDAMVEQNLDGLREQFADFIEAADRPLAAGDIAVIAYEGSIDGRPVAEAAPGVPDHLAARDNHWVRMEEGGFLPGFTAQIEGMAIGDTRDNVTVAFGADFPVEALRGRTAAYQVRLLGIREKHLPEADDAFASRILPGKTMDFLRTHLRERLAARIAERKHGMIADQILAYLDRSVEIDLPTDVVHRETQRRVDEIVQRGQMQGLKEEDIVAEKDRIFANATSQARMGVKASFILERIAEKEDIKVTKAEFEARIHAIARQEGKPLRKVMEELQKNRSLGGITHQLLLSKTLDFLVEQAAVTEVAPSADPGA